MYEVGHGNLREVPLPRGNYGLLSRGELLRGRKFLLRFLLLSALFPENNLLGLSGKSFRRIGRGTLSQLHTHERNSMASTTPQSLTFPFPKPPLRNWPHLPQGNSEIDSSSSKQLSLPSFTQTENPPDGTRNTVIKPPYRTVVSLGENLRPTDRAPRPRRCRETEKYD